MKKITSSKQLQKQLKKGITKLNDAVKVTMGPRGRNVIISRKNQLPFLTKDGVTVAQEVQLKNTLQNVGAQIVKEVSYNTAQEAGDGTTTSTVLACEIFTEGLKFVNSHDPVEMKRGIDYACESIVKNLIKNSKKITAKDIKNIATISANGDTNIANLITDAITAVGRDGIITVEENSKNEDKLDIAQGYEFHRGFVSPYFINEEEKERVSLETPYILITDQRISQLQNMMSILEQVQMSGRPLLIIADDFEDDVVSSLVLNNIKKIMHISAVKAPGFGEMKKIRLQDIALKTGGTVISKDQGNDLSNINLSDLGQANKLYITKDKTIIIDGSGNQEEIEKQIVILKEQIKETDTEFLQERIAKLAGGVAVIKVGSVSEFEMKEKKDRFDDAVEATKSAIQEGVVTGGGFALIHASDIKRDASKTDSFKVGEEIIIKSISAPAIQIIKNAGGDLDLMENIKDHGIKFGVNSLTNSIEDLHKSGIIDPLKVERIALQNACSVAGMLLTSAVSVTDID